MSLAKKNIWAESFVKKSREIFGEKNEKRKKYA